MKTMTAVTHKDLDNLRTELGAKMDAGFDEVLTEMRGFTSMVAARFDAVDVRFERVESDIHKIRADIQRIFSQLDSIEKRLEISEDERIILGHQIDRAYKWLKQVADKVGVELKP